MKNPINKKSTKSKSVSKSKVTSGGLKTKPKWKFGVLAIATIMFVSFVGYSAYGRWKVRDLQAKAENWTVLVGYNYRSIPKGERYLACKTAVSGPFGNLYKVKFQVTRNPDLIFELRKRMIQIAVFDQNNIYTPSNVVTQNKWLYNVVAGTETYVSRDTNQNVEFRLYFYTNAMTTVGVYPTSFRDNPANLTNC